MVYGFVAMGGSMVGRFISTNGSVQLDLFAQTCRRLRNNTCKFVIQYCMKLFFVLMVVYLKFAAVLVTCYCHVHVFGSLIGLETLRSRGCTCSFCCVFIVCFVSDELHCIGRDAFSHAFHIVYSGNGS